MARKVSTTDMGDPEPAWHLDDLMKILPILRAANVGVLGGDVLILADDQYIHTYDNWYANHEAGETNEAFSERSIAKTIDYLAKYPNANDPKFAFLIVCTSVPSK